MALILCPECNKEISSMAISCPNCGFPINKEKYKIIITGFDVDTSALAGIKEVFNIDFSYEDGMKILNNLPYMIAEYDTKEEVELYVRKLKSIRWGLEISIESPINEKHFSVNNNQNDVQCPKCGSTQIQVVQRKWSLLTGILTNKVDRVCISCKYKF